MKAAPDRGGPLAGVRVLDLTSVVSGPVAMGILADQGADVIKVESFQGDIMRAQDGKPGMTPGFVSCNRGKRSLALNLKEPAAKEILWHLLESADVFAQNFRPGAIERLGFSADEVLKKFPKLIYLSINGVGEKGPYANKRVYDPVIQSLSGLADIQADPITHRPRMVRTLIADKTTSVYAAQAVCAALFSRERSGQGQHIRLSMLDVMVAFLWPEGMNKFTVVADDTQHAVSTVHDMIFPTSDGFVTFGTVSDQEWRALCGVINRPDLVEDPRFTTTTRRAKNRQERLEIVEAATAGISTEALLEALEAGDVPCAPVLGRRQMIDNPQVVANDLVQTLDQPGLGEIRQARPAARFDGSALDSISVAPSLGEHTHEVLAEHGFSEAQITEFLTQAVVR